MTREHRTKALDAMRTAIVCIVSVTLGVVGGAVATRMQYQPRIGSLASQQAEIEEMNTRLNSDLRFAAERLEWVEAENSSLREQVAALQSGGPAPGATVGANVSDAAASGAVGAPTQADRSGTATSAAERGNGMPTGAGMGSATAAAESGASAAEGQTPTPEDEAVVMRERVGEFIAREMAEASDSATAERLANIDAHLKQVRDLYKALGAAQTPEERAQIHEAVSQNRANLKQLVEQQQAAEMRQVLVRSGISDPGTQRQLISSMRELRESPYWRDPMMIWGTAAPETEE